MSDGTQDWPDPHVGARVYRNGPRGQSLGHVVAVFDHGGARRYVIAEWGPHKQRWFYTVEIGYAFKVGIWSLTRTP